MKEANKGVPVFGKFRIGWINRAMPLFIYFTAVTIIMNILMALKLHNIARQSLRSVYLSCNSLSIIQKIQAPVTISLEKSGLSP